MKENYQKLLDKIIEKNQERGILPSLLLHACCAPCSSYVLEYLSHYFKITVYFYNPNITGVEEYQKRVAEIQRLIKELPVQHPVNFVEGEYRPENFFSMAKGLENCPERGERCRKCYEMRLKSTAELAEKMHFDYFCTTLSISPLKNAVWLNDIGRELSKTISAAWLDSDFKKKEGYKRSIELSAEYHLYRQNFCGCIFSKREALAKGRGNSTCHE